jgi:hypothetical protein
MPRYEVLRDCFGFQRKYWKRGEIVELESGIEVPKYFRRLPDDSPAPPSGSAPVVSQAADSEVPVQPHTKSKSDRKMKSTR